MGRVEDARQLDLDGVLCLVCGETVPIGDWHRLEWYGQDPPPSEPFGSGGQWRAVTHGWAPFVRRGGE